MVNLSSVQLKRFLDSCRIPAGIQSTAITHVGLSGFWRGKYAVPADKLDEFISLYISAIRSGEVLTLAETHDAIGPFVIDIDLRYPVDASFSRRYTMDDLRSMAEIYNTAIRSVVGATDEQMVCYVFEKRHPMRSGGHVKDGIHIVYPHLVADHWIQFAVRDKVVDAYKERPVFRDAVNDPEDIFDAAVIRKNAWMMAGSAKTPDAQVYEVTHVWDANLDEQLIPDIGDIVYTCRLRGHDRPTVGVLDGVEVHQGPDPTGRFGSATASGEIHDPALNLRYTSNDIEYAKQLVSILDKGRFEDYQSWLDIGIALYNIDACLLDTWIEWSRSSPKFVEGECEKKWKTFHKRGMGLGTLCHWAKLDNPEVYREVREQSELGFIERALSSTNRDVAKLVHFRFRREYVCVSEKHRTWFKFEGHRWIRSDGGYQLRKHIMESLSDTVYEALTDLRSRSDASPDDKVLQKTKDNYERLYRSIGGRSFVDDVVSVCSSMFLDPNFRDRQDDNPSLLGFTNGILDLDKNEFRDGLPEDYVTLSTHIEYHPFDSYAGDPRMLEVMDFLNQILPEPTIRDYVLTVMASSLYGRNVEQRLHIWTGSGSNGKSKLIELLEMAMGDYAARMPTSMLTQKRGASSAASPEVARLVGRRFVSAHEPENGDRIYVGVMKELTGGDKIMARGLYEDPFEFTPQFKIVMSCNTLPVIPSTDGGTWRRLRVVDFKTKFVDDPREPHERKIDIAIGEKMHTWAEPFMALLVKYYRDYTRGGTGRPRIPEPDAVTEHTRRYQRQSDSVMNYLYETVEFTGREEDVISMDDLYYGFKMWFQDSYSERVMNRLDFLAQLETKGLNYTKKSLVGGKYKVEPSHVGPLGGTNVIEL